MTEGKKLTVLMVPLCLLVTVSSRETRALATWLSSGHTKHYHTQNSYYMSQTFDQMGYEYTINNFKMNIQYVTITTV